MVVVFALFGGYTVAFDTSGGTEIASQKLRYGNYIEKPEDPVRQGYEFAGWYEGETKISDENPYTFFVEKSIRLTAKFVKNDPAEKESASITVTS